MNNTMFGAARWLLLVTTFLGLTGCASSIVLEPKIMPDGKMMVSGLIQNPIWDGVVVTTKGTCVFERALSPEEQQELLKDPTKAKCAQYDVKQYANNPAARDVITTSAAPVMTAIVQGEESKSAIREQARQCEKGKCGNSGPVIVNNNSAAAASESKSKTEVGMNVGVSLGCAAAGNCPSAAPPAPAPNPPGN